jgi:hypothetical protein
MAPLMLLHSMARFSATGRERPTGPADTCYLDIQDERALIWFHKHLDPHPPART